MNANGDGDHDDLANEELDRLVIALHAAREQTEQGEAVRWGEPVIGLIRAIAVREAEIFPPPLRQEVEGAVTRGVATALSAALRIYFSPSKLAP